MAPLSVSAIISGLHLSDIDWESASFTSSPLPPANTCVTVQPKLVHTPHNGAKNSCDNSQNTKILKATDSRSVLEQVIKDLPLKEQVIRKNEGPKINTNYIISKPEEKTFPIKQSPSQNTILHTQQYHKKSELSEKATYIPKKGKNMPHLHASYPVKPDLYVSKQPVRAAPLDPVVIHSSSTCSAPQKPKTFKFVKTAIASSIVSQRSYSDPEQRDKVKNKMASKKSVCKSVGFSSDSECENQAAPQRKSKTSVKNKHSDISLKCPLKAKMLLEDNTPEQRKCNDVYPSSIACDGFTQCPASPPIDLNNDDSVICSDSPLPLAERLKLKFQK